MKASEVTEDGWYWVRFSGQPEPMVDSRESWKLYDDDDKLYVEWLTYGLSFPLPEPVEVICRILPPVES